MSALPKISQARLDLVLEPDEAGRLANLNGPFDAHLRQIELRLGIEIRNRGNRFQLVGAKGDVARGEAVLQSLFNQTADDVVTTESVHLALAEAGENVADSDEEPASRDEVVIRTKRGVVRGRGLPEEHHHARPQFRRGARRHRQDLSGGGQRGAGA
jgi:phosphate starvation-inducible protein PhoH and related proteins